MKFAHDRKPPAGHSSEGSGCPRKFRGRPDCVGAEFEIARFGGRRRNHINCEPGGPQRERHYHSHTGCETKQTIPAITFHRWNVSQLMRISVSKQREGVAVQFKNVERKTA